MRKLDGGRRQIFMFLMPGDLVGSISHWPMDGQFEVCCLTPVELVDVTPLVSPADPCPNPAIAKYAHLAAHEADTLLLDHITRLGAMTAKQGVAHLLLELYARLEWADLAKDDWFPLPIGQRPLGQAMGLSVMHMNTTLKQLRADGLVELGPGWAKIIDRHGLTELACPRHAFASAGRLKLKQTSS